MLGVILLALGDPGGGASGDRGVFVARFGFIRPACWRSSARRGGMPSGPT